MPDFMDKSNLLVLGNVTQFLVASALRGLNYLTYSDDNHGKVHRHTRIYANEFPQSSFIVIVVLVFVVDTK